MADRFMRPDGTYDYQAERESWRAKPFLCSECRTEVKVGDPFFRYMVAEHKNAGVHAFASRKRVLDVHVCLPCHRAALQAFIDRHAKVAR